MAGEEIEQLRECILSKPIFAIVSDTCSYCKTFIDTVKKIGYYDRLQQMKEEEYGDFFKKAREIVKDVYKHRTVPAVFVNGWFVGGNDNFQAMKGQIDKILSGKVLERSLVLTKQGAIQNILGTEGQYRGDL